jgi:hypothetical protein
VDTRTIDFEQWFKTPEGKTENERLLSAQRPQPNLDKARQLRELIKMINGLDTFQSQMRPFDNGDDVYIWLNSELEAEIFNVANALRETKNA